MKPVWLAAFVLSAACRPPLPQTRSFSTEGVTELTVLASLPPGERGTRETNFSPTIINRTLSQIESFPSRSLNISGSIGSHDSVAAVRVRRDGERMTVDFREAIEIDRDQNTRVSMISTLFDLRKLRLVGVDFAEVVYSVAIAEVELEDSAADFELSTSSSIDWSTRTMSFRLDSSSLSIGDHSAQTRLARLDFSLVNGSYLFHQAAPPELVLNSDASEVASASGFNVVLNATDSEIDRLCVLDSLEGSISRGTSIAMLDCDPEEVRLEVDATSTVTGQP